MSRFLGRKDFERSCRVAGITELATDPETGAYLNADTHKAFLVWDSVAQSSHAATPPPGYLVRRRGLNVNMAATRPYSRATPEELESLAQRGIEVLALYPAMPTSSASADAVLAERQRQVSVKGYHPQRDQRYVEGELVDAAISYSIQAVASVLLPSTDSDLCRFDQLIETFWPWPGAPIKKEEPLRALEKAAALLIAEHERLSAVEAEQ